MKMLQKVKVVLRNSTIAVIGAVVAMTASCAHKAVVPPKAVIVAAPVQSKPVAPRAATVATKVDNASTATTAVQLGLTKAIAEADRLRKQKAATEAELVSMWKALTAAAEDVKAVNKALEDARIEADLLQLEAGERDREVSELRRDRENLTVQLDSSQKNAVDLAKANADLSKKAHIYEFFRTQILWVLAIAAVGAILWFVIPLIIKSLKPIP